MNDPVLYSRRNYLPRRDAKELLEAKASKIKWKYIGDRCLDIGSADGGVTMDIVRTYLPENYGKLVGCDISGNMVRYANEHYRDERIYFIEHDITSDITKEMRDGFDHVFSFYALHWEQNQRLCMTNIWNMLASGGDCLLMMIARVPIYDVYRLLAKNPRWTPWLASAEQFISPYQDSLEPEKELQDIMEDIGFKNVEVTRKHKSHLFSDLNLFKETIAALCPFKIPEDMKQIYLEDFLETAIRHKVMEEVLDKNGMYLGLDFIYTILWVYGSK